MHPRQQGPPYQNIIDATPRMTCSSAGAPSGKTAANTYSGDVPAQRAGPPVHVAVSGGRSGGEGNTRNGHDWACDVLHSHQCLRTQRPASKRPAPAGASRGHACAAWDKSGGDGGGGRRRWAAVGAGALPGAVAAVLLLACIDYIADSQLTWRALSKPTCASLLARLGAPPSQGGLPSAPRPALTSCSSCRNFACRSASVAHRLEMLTDAMPRAAAASCVCSGVSQ